ncbi:MAG: methyltransferase domain-containing protein [Clostridia bacterium]|nr:methyltransferase domain-containing protein [Clostridia bacterium]
MSGYSQFADVYDLLMGDADYQKRYRFFRKLFLQYDRPPSLLLDVACGTGEFSCLFAKDGTEVIGVDASEEMLSVAREKSVRQDLDILFLCQRMEDLDLYGTVDGAICCLDSLNHLTDFETLCRALERIALFLEEGRLFLFDVNTVYKHLNILSDRTFAFEQNGVYCVWQNETDPQSAVTSMTLDFFTEQNGLYRRNAESFSERAYTTEEWDKALCRAGLETLAILSDLSEKAPTPETERVIYVTRKCG